MTIREFRIKPFFDAHVHFREGSMLPTTVHAIGAYCTDAVAMPNLREPVRTCAQAEEYARTIRMNQSRAGEFTPIMTIKMLQSFKERPPTLSKNSIKAVKMYPVHPTSDARRHSDIDPTDTSLHRDVRASRGAVTTNAEEGVSSLRDLSGFLGHMERTGIILSLHAEDPTVEVMDREGSFLRTELPWLVRSFPKLKIVVEHVSTAIGVAIVRGYKRNVAATITAHHLLLTHDDVCGGRLQPHHHCMPTPKRLEDQKALINAVTSGDPRFFYGSDSAPHIVGQKECASGCAGVYTAPVAPSVLAQLFNDWNAVDRLEGFTSKFGREFYELGPGASWDLTFHQESWTVPEQYDGIVPFLAGKTLEWQVARS